MKHVTYRAKRSICGEKLQRRHSRGFGGTTGVPIKPPY